MGRQAIIPKHEGRCYILECKRDVEKNREREREKVRKREFRFRAHAPPYKRENFSLMGQLNRYYHRVHKWLFNFWPSFIRR